ncbi:kinase-like domain [Fusarium albosuccineum]|uniref:Kinase-like domain n=1 Tax=Fusarium albosuccineum TaxID=1237068 RepID=A0A8H4L6J9_9HYPO|nr:kinase-like domain [Fusarium albosuccineum]
MDAAIPRITLTMWDWDSWDTSNDIWDWQNSKSLRDIGSPQLSTYTSNDENHHSSVNELTARRKIKERNSMVWNWLPDDSLDHEELPEAEDLSRTQTPKEKQSDCGYGQDDYMIIASNHNWGDAPGLYSILNTEERFQPESSEAAVEKYGRMVDDTDSAAPRTSTWGTRRPSLSDPDVEEGRMLSPTSDSAIMLWGQHITPVGTPQPQIEPHNNRPSLTSAQGPVPWSCLSSLTPATSPKSSFSHLAVGNAMNDREIQSDLLRSGSLGRPRTTRPCWYKGTWRDSGLGLESPSCSPSPETRYQAEAGYAATGHGGCPSPYSISDCDGSSHADLPVPNNGDVSDSIKPGPQENILGVQNTAEVNNCDTQTATERDNNDSKGGEDAILCSDPSPDDDEPKPATRKEDLGIRIRAKPEPRKDCEPLIHASVRTRRQKGFARVKIDILSLSWPLKAPLPEPSEDERSTDDGFDESEATFQDLCEPEGNLTFQDQSLGGSGDSSSCWKAFETRDKATAHSTQSETCEAKEVPTDDRFMYLEDEGKIERLGCSGSAEDIWWKIIRLVIPGMLGQTPEHLRCDYSLYYLRFDPSFMIPGLTFPNASFQPDQPNVPGSKHPREPACDRDRTIVRATTHYHRLPSLTAFAMAATSEKQIKEEGCIATTFERKYYHRDSVFIKRSLRPNEFRTGYRGLHHTDIPVPTVYCHFEDDGAYYLITEYIEGVSMSELPEEQKAVVREELESQRAKLKTLKSCRLGGPSGLVIPPYRVLQRTKTDDWNLRLSSHDEYVFCHNDLSQQNVIVDPDTLKIRAIIDWEYAGFFPPRFEYPFYNRLGPSSAINDEVDDSLDLLEFLHSEESVSG